LFAWEQAIGTNSRKTLECGAVERKEIREQQSHVKRQWNDAYVNNSRKWNDAQV
jgi:hypothetical protein